MSYYIDAELPHIFIHIPKTAGASILKVIQQNYNYNVIPNYRTTYKNYHSTLADFDNFLCEYNCSFYVFTIVRNPWSRAASWFHFRKEVLRKGLKALSAGKHTKKVIEDYDLIVSEYEVMNKDFNIWLKNYYKQRWDHSWFSLFDTQSSWLESSKCSIDKIIKFENLNKEINEVSIFKNKILPMYNKNPVNYRYVDMYNSESINLIKNIYEIDIDNFKYTFK